MDIAQDGVAWRVGSNGQEWDIAWFPPPDPPDGTMHGSSAVCFAAGQVVLISSDASLWGLPGGRPESGEDWLDVLKREIYEEACAIVSEQQLLGYFRAICTAGHQSGLVLVRAWWAATVELLPWQPEHEITDRKLVAPEQVYGSLWVEDGFAPMYRRILTEAGIYHDD